MEVTLREPSDAEFKQLAEFSFENFVLESSRSSGEPIESLKSKLGGPPLDRRPNDVWLIIESADKRVGFVWFEKDAERKSAFGWDIYLETEFRSKGIGRRAMKLCGEFLLRSSIDFVKICVYEHNTIARTFYESLGFKTENFDEQRRQYTLKLALAESGFDNRN